MEEIFTQENINLINETNFDKILEVEAEDLKIFTIIKKIKELSYVIIQNLRVEDNNPDSIQLSDQIEFYFNIFILKLSIKDGVIFGVKDIINSLKKILNSKKLFRKGRRTFIYLISDVFRNFKIKMTLNDYKTILDSIPKEYNY